MLGSPTYRRFSAEYHDGGTARDRIASEKSPLPAECAGAGCGVVNFEYQSESAVVVTDLLGQRRTHTVSPALEGRKHVSMLTEHRVPVVTGSATDLAMRDRASVNEATPLTDLVTRFQYDVHGEIRRLEHPNDMVATYTYEPRDFGAAKQVLKSIEEKASPTAGPSIITTFEYYDGGRVRNIPRSIAKRDDSVTDVPEIVRALPFPIDSSGAGALKSKVTDDDAEVTTEYDSAGRPANVKRTAPGEESDPATQKLTYHDTGGDNARGRLFEVHAGGGEGDDGTKVKIEYEADGLQGEKITTADLRRNVSSVEVRDSYDRLISRQIQRGASEILTDEKLGYDSEGRLRVHVRRQSGVGDVRTDYTYDAAGRLTGTSMTHAAVAGSSTPVKTKIEYDLGAHQVTEFAPFTGTACLFTRTETDSLGRPVRIEQTGGAHTLEQRLGYDISGALAYETDGVRGAELRQIDKHGRPVIAVRADGTRTRTAWNAWGELLRIDELSALGSAGEPPVQVAGTRYLYTKEGRQRGVSEQIGGALFRSTRSNFSFNGRTEIVRVGTTTPLVTELDPSDNLRTTRIVRDKAGRVQQQVYGQGQFHLLPTADTYAETFIDTFSGAMPETTTYKEPRAGASYVTSAIADALGRVAELREASNSYITKSTYDEAGNVRTTQPAGYTGTWSQQYDSRGLVVQSAAPEGKTVLRQYDALGNLLLYHDEDGQETVYERDPLGRIRKTTYPDDSSEEVIYETGTGRIAAHRDRAGVWRSFFYDAGGRVVEERLGQRDPAAGVAPSGTEWLKYSYDLGGRLREIRSRDAAIQYDQHDFRGRPSITRTLRFANASGFASPVQLLDAHTQQHIWTIFDGERERYRMPAAGMSVPATEDAASPWRSWIAEQHDPGGNIVSQRSSGPGGEPGPMITTAVGRGMGRLSSRSRFFGIAGHTYEETFGYADGEVPGAAPGPASGLMGRVQVQFADVPALDSVTKRDSARRVAIVDDFVLAPRRSDFGYDNRGRLHASSLLRTEDSGSLVTDDLIHADFRQSRTVTTAPQDLAELGAAASSVVPPSWTATKNELHQITSRTLSNESAPRVYDFDAGRRTGDGKWTSTYDENGRLVTLSRGTAQIRYTYGPHGRIVGRTAQNVTGDVLPAQTTWVWDPLVDRLLAIYEAGKSVEDGAGADAGLIQQFLHGDAGYDDPIEVSVKQADGSVKRYLPLIDYAAAGSVQAVLSSTSGKLAERVLYADPYGDRPRYLHGAVVDRMSVELRKGNDGELAEAKVRVRLSESIDESTLAGGVQLAAISSADAVVATTTATPELEDAHTILWTLGPVQWAALTTAPEATRLEIAVTQDLRAALWDGPVMPLPPWMLDASGRASTAAFPVIQRESISALAELLAATSSGQTRKRTLLELHNLYLVASENSKTRVLTGFKAAPFLEPATGLVYLRNRWFDASTGTFLTPDPMGYGDSSNLYVFGQADPVNNSDPLGLESIRKAMGFEADIDQGRKIRGYPKAWAYSFYNIVTFGFVMRHDDHYEEYERTRDTGAYLRGTAVEIGRAGIAIAATYATGGFGAGASITIGGAIARGAAGGATAGVITTAAGDAYDRWTGGPGMTSADYLYSAAGGAVFGGAAGAVSYRIQIAAARTEFKKRTAAMLADDVGYNVSPEEWFGSYKTIGRHGTYVTDEQAIIKALGSAHSQKYQVGWRSGANKISYWKAWRMERALGLERGSLFGGFRITQVRGISAMNPRPPVSGNRYFRGLGVGLPGGGPELVVDPIPTAPWP